MKPSPPNSALKFLRWFWREDYIDEIEGDIIEVFEKQYASSPTKAQWNLLGVSSGISGQSSSNHSKEDRP